MKFHYRKYTFQKKSELLGQYAPRPVIKIHLVYEGQSVLCPAIIDSGADVCIFPADIGEQLGIDVRSGEKGFSTNLQTGAFEETFLHRITLKIGEFYYPTIASFSYAPQRSNYAVLGQLGFFDLFIVQFDLMKEEIELRERK
jgi:hypothetical protein